MDKEYWQWKNTIIDFNAISDEKIDCNNFITKKDYVFRYLGIPDNEMHEWYSGCFSSEYNEALRYAKQLGLVEDVIDYEDKIYNLEQQIKKQKEVIDNAIKCIEKDYYSKNTFDIDNIGMTTNKLLQVRNILKEVSE